MDAEGEILPFFQKFSVELEYITNQPEAACKDLVERDPVFFNKTLFRSFLFLTKKECENMSLTDYENYCIMLKKTLELHHPSIDR